MMSNTCTEENATHGSHTTREAREHCRAHSQSWFSCHQKNSDGSFDVYVCPRAVRQISVWGKRARSRSPKAPCGAPSRRNSTMVYVVNERRLSSSCSAAGTQARPHETQHQRSKNLAVRRVASASLLPLCRKLLVVAEPKTSPCLDRANYFIHQSTLPYYIVILVG